MYIQKRLLFFHCALNISIDEKKGKGANSPSNTECVSQREVSVCLSDTLGNKLAFGDTEDGNHGGLWFSLYFTFYVKRQFLITLVEISISSFKFVEKTEVQVFKSPL